MINLSAGWPCRASTELGATVRSTKASLTRRAASAGIPVRIDSCASCGSAWCRCTGGLEFLELQDLADRQVEQRGLAQLHLRLECHPEDHGARSVSGGEARRVERDLDEIYRLRLRVALGRGVRRNFDDPPRQGPPVLVRHGVEAQLHRYADLELRDVLVGDAKLRDQAAAVGNDVEQRLV